MLPYSCRPWTTHGGQPSSDNGDMTDDQPAASSSGAKLIETIEDSDGRLTTVTIKYSNGKEWRFSHRFPDTLTHYYEARGTNQKIPLHQGRFKPAAEQDDRIYNGGVWYSWTPTPRVVASGERTIGDDYEDIDSILQSPDRERIWTPMVAIEPILSEPSPLPPQPDTLPPPWSKAAGTAFTTPRLQPCEIGRGVEIDRITAIIPNGWQSLDGWQVCSPDDLSKFWRGRALISEAGWDIKIDRLEEMVDSAWDELKDTGGARATHVMELRKTDQSPFDASEADEVTEILRIALSFAVGRSTAAYCLSDGEESRQYGPDGEAARSTHIRRYTLG